MRRRVQRSRVAHDRWLVSYADFITMLFGLFVVLYAFAKADQKKQVQVTESIDSAFRALGLFPDASRQGAGGPDSILGTGRTVNPRNVVIDANVLSAAMVKGDLNRMRGELEQGLANQVAAHAVSIHMGRDGLVISLREAGFFASGSAAPRPETLPTVRQIAARLAQTSYDLRVEGHTDNMPIHTAEFDSNWELSAARATCIARLFLDLKAVPPERISASGYAEYRPVATNETAEGRAENRRVDLIVLPKSGVDLSAPEPVHEAGAWRKITDEE